MIRIIPLALLALAMLATTAQAQQGYLYGPDGRVIGRSATDSQGNVTRYDAQGRVTTRESTDSGGQTTVRDDKGRMVGRYTSPQR